MRNNADVNIKSIDGTTPLHAAAANDFKELVELLLANKANVNSRDTYGQTPLHLAVARSNENVAELLRKHGGQDTTAPTSGTTIHDAAEAGDLATVKALLKDNPDLVFSKDDSNSGGTPLHIAAFQGPQGRCGIAVG